MVTQNFRLLEDDHLVDILMTWRRFAGDDHESLIEGLGHILGGVQIICIATKEPGQPPILQFDDVVHDLVPRSSGHGR